MFLNWRRKRSDVAAEIRSHLDLETDDLIAEGLPAEEARAAARRRFGSIAALQERLYEAGRPLWLDHVQQDAICAWRSLKKYPVASTVAVFSLAAGIGSTTVTLTLRDALFRNPPPLYRQPDQLSEVFTVTRRGSRQGVPARLYDIWAKEPRDNQTWSAARTPRREDVRTTDRMETLPVRAVSPNLFSLLGVPAAIGRTLRDLDSDRSTAVVLSYRAWQTLFDGRDDAIGMTVWIAERPYAVVGVMPERFWFLDTGAFLWTALDIAALAPDETLTVVVRRPPNLSPLALRDTLRTGVDQYDGTLPEAERGRRADVAGVGGAPLVRGVSLLLPYLLGGCVVLTWFIACANVAVLMMAQWTSREHEFAVRAALGAGRRRVIRLLLTESVLVAALGGGLGVCLTFALRGVLLHYARSPVSLFDTSIHAGVLLQSALLTVITGMVAGLAPALYETRRLSANPLRAITSERLRQRWRHALVVAEITATVALLVVLGAMIDGYRRNVSADMGYPTGSLLVLRVDNPGGVRSGDILEFLKSLPGVTQAGAATSAPFSAEGGVLRRVSFDEGSIGGLDAEVVQIGPTFLPTLGVAVRGGRGFSAEEAARPGTAALVNEALATRLWPGVNPVGRGIRVDNGRFEVIGVVADYLHAPVSKVIPAVFMPLPPYAPQLTRVRFVMRAPVAEGPLIAALRRDIRRIGSGHVLATAFTVDDTIAVAGQEILFGTLPLVPLVIIGMLLTASGVYAVLAFALARRSKEFALRIAIGASDSHLIRLVAEHSLWLIGVGSVLGVMFTFALSRVVRASGGAGSMFDTPAWPAFMVPTLIIALVGTIATWIPSRRALRTEPAVLLRVD